VEKPDKDMFDPRIFLAKVGTGKQVLEFHKNQHVFEQGDVADTVFYIQRGKVKLTVVSEQGKEAVVAILEAGQFFGEGCMNGHPLRIATTTAIEDCVITSITKDAMIRAIHDEPKFSELFMAYLLTRNSRIEEDLIDQLFNSSERRLARLLLLLSNFGKEGSIRGRRSRRHPLRQESMARNIGPGSWHCWRGDQPRSPPSHLPTRLPGWLGPWWSRASIIRNLLRLRGKRDRAGQPA
jgi:CRP/FNR family transcriptional regulator, cyclic AMP receptor protein